MSVRGVHAGRSGQNVWLHHDHHWQLDADLQKGRPDHVVAARPQSAGVHNRGAQQLRELVRKQPDMTLEEIRTHFGKNCSLPTVSNTLARLGLTFKKRR